MLDRLELRHGRDLSMRHRLLPIVIRILDSGPPSAQRTSLLRLVVEAYTSHMRVRDTVDKLRTKLRERLNEVYGEILGIQPPGVGPGA